MQICRQQAGMGHSSLPCCILPDRLTEPRVSPSVGTRLLIIRALAVGERVHVDKRGVV